MGVVVYVVFKSQCDAQSHLAQQNVVNKFAERAY
jgi:hypothetical protein